MIPRILSTFSRLLMISLAFASPALAADPKKKPLELPVGVTELDFKEPVNISGDGLLVLGFKRDKGVIADLGDILYEDYTSLKSLLSDDFSGLCDYDRVKWVEAYGVSKNGTFISGSIGLKDDCDTVTKAFVADLESETVRLLTNYSGDDDAFRSANDVSDDGLSAVGEEWFENCGITGSRALWWRDTTDGCLAPTLLAPLRGGVEKDSWMDDGAWAAAMDGAGTRAVGASYYNYGRAERTLDDDGEFSRAVYWDLTGDSPQAKLIGSLRTGEWAGSGQSEATDISRNGDFIVGWAQTDSKFGVAPFLSYQGQGMVAIASPDSNYTQFGEALGVSNDGTAVGYFDADPCADVCFDSIAFIASPAWGSKTIGDWLKATGVEVSDSIHYLEASAISEDGKVVVGLAQEAGCEVGFIARAGSGSIEPTSFSQTLGGAGSIGPQASQTMSTVLNGAHHIPLQLMKGPSRHVWFTTDGGRWDRYNSNSLLTEIGAAVDLFDNQLLVGFGFGLNWIEQELGAIDANLDGQYYLTELSYKPTKLPFIFTLTGALGNWDATARRSYLTAGVPDASTGRTDILSSMLRFSVHWLDVVKVAGFGITPKLQYSVNHTSIDGYTENGGAFPVAFNEQNSTAQELRYGLWASRNFLNDKLLVRFRVEAVQRFDKMGPGTSGTVVGLFNFNMPGQTIRQAWTQFGTDLVYSVTPNTNLTFSVNTATAGEDPVILGSAGVQVKF